MSLYFILCTQRYGVSDGMGSVTIGIHTIEKKVGKEKEEKRRKRGEERGSPEHLH